MKRQFDADQFGDFFRDYERIRFHEAGHAVVAHLLRYRPTSVTAATEEDLANGRAGMTHYAPRVIERDPNPKRARMALCVALAGGVAERIIDPTSRGGDEEDRDLAENIAERFLAPETARRELQRAAIRALSLLRKHWQAVEAIADELLANEGELDGAAVRRCIREWAQNGHS